MTVIVENGRFHSRDPRALEFKPLAEKSSAVGNHGLDLPNDIDPAELPDAVLGAPAFRIPFPSSADGRGNSIASGLRQRGYRGHLRAWGHILADQYPLALRSGFDDVEIDDDLAARQPETQWAEAKERTSLSYQTRLQSRSAA